jgi:hypothetical protein
MIQCNFCNNNFTNKHTLSNHQSSAKYCLKLQKKDYVTDHKCEGCLKTFTIVYDLNIHRKKCKASELFYNLQNQISELQTTLFEKDTENKIYIKQLENQKDKYEKEIRILQDKYEKEIRILQDKLENIAIKAVQRPTTTNMNKTNINNYIHNMQPISSDHLLEQSSNLTLEHIQKGASGYAEYALDYPLKDRIACVDYSRRKMKFKDKDGDLITDPEMIKLAPMFFDSIKDKSSEIVYDLNKQDMDSSMFEEVAKLFNTNCDVKNGATGIKTEFYYDFIKHVCSGSVIE